MMTVRRGEVTNSYYRSKLIEKRSSDFEIQKTENGYERSEVGKVKRNVSLNNLLR